MIRLLGRTVFWGIVGMADSDYKPEGSSSVSPYLTIDGVEAALQWYEQAFGARRGRCLKVPSGQVAYAEFTIGDTVVMACEEHPMFDTKGPKTYGGSPVSLHLYAPDVDALIAGAVAQGAVLKKAVEQQFFGDRSGMVVDPFGYSWIISTHVEDVAFEEVERRWHEMSA